MKLFYIFIINLLLIFFNSIITASEREGLGFAIEGGSYKPTYDTTDKDLQSSNLYGFTFDYQWLIGHSFSFSIIGFERGGESDSPPKSDYNYYKSGFLGASIKLWIGSIFIDIHSGEYYLTWIKSLNSFTGVAHKSGYGFGLGIETESGIIIAAFNEKSGIITSEDIPNQKVGGNRIMLGYRW